MTDSAPDTPEQGEPQPAAQRKFIFLRKKPTADAAEGPTGGQDTAPVAAQAAAHAEPDDRVRPGVLRRRRRQLMATYEQAIFDLGGLALEMHGRGLLAEDILRRRAAEAADLRAQIDELGGRLDEIRQGRQERRQAGRGAAVTCPACGARSRANANFCASCGTPLQPGVGGAPADPDTPEADQPTQVVIEEQVTSVIVEAPVDMGQTQAIPSPGDAAEGDGR